jgi:hypothetical protein
MCLFIDGLDEYGNDGVDNYKYEELAKSLITWIFKMAIPRS